MNTKKVLLTGGAGYIGSHTAVALIEKGFEPVIVDDLRNSHSFVISNIEAIVGRKVVFHQVDCCDETAMKSVFEEHVCFVGVIHFAAYKAVGESVDHPTMYYKNNIQSLVLILDLMKEFKVDNFIFSSSCTVYGIPDHIPVTEATPMKEASSPYGYTKQVGERICTDWSNSSNSKITLLRYFNPVGAHESALLGELPIGKPQNLVPFIMQSAIGKLGALTVYGNDYDTRDGSCIRDYIHVVDLAEAHVSALEKSINDGDQKVVLNLGTGRGATVLELINAFKERTGQQLEYSIGDRRSGDVPAIYADCSFGESYINWKARYSMEDALEHAWKWENYIKENHSN